MAVALVDNGWQRYDVSMRRMMRAATKMARKVRAMVTTMRVVCDKEGDGDGSKSNGDKGVMQ